MDDLLKPINEKLNAAIQAVRGQRYTHVADLTDFVYPESDDITGKVKAV